MLFVLGAAELLASIFLPPPPIDKAPLPKAQPHPTLGYTLIPNQRSYTYGQLVRTNGDGLREKELSLDQLRQSFVILCLGGSETFGKGVTFEGTYPKKLEKMLNDSISTQPMTVINAGVPDYNTLQQLRFLQERGLRYHPDIVVIGFYWDDLLPLPSLTGTGDQKEAPREWILRTWAKQYDLLDIISPLYTRSRILYLVRDNLKNLLGRWQGNMTQEWRSALLEGRQLPGIEDAWQQFRNYLSQFLTLARQEHFRLILLILPIEQQFEKNYPQTRFQEVVAEIAHDLSIETIDVYSSFQKTYSDSPSLFIPYDGRPNTGAHAVVAKELYKYLRKVLNLHE